MSTLTHSQPRPVLPPTAAPTALPATLPGRRPWPRVAVFVCGDGSGSDAAVASVAAQVYPHVEPVVISGSRSAAIRQAAAYADADLVAFLAPGEQLAPGAVAAAAMAFDLSGVAIVAGLCSLHDVDGRHVGSHVTSCHDGVPLPLQELLDLENRWAAGQFFRGPEVFFARAALRRAGAAAESAEGVAADYELYLRLSHRGAALRVIGRPMAEASDRPWDVGPELVAVRDAFLTRVGNRVRWNRPPARPPTKPSLRVAMVNDHGFRYGAGIAHGRLATAIALGGHEVVPVALASDGAYDPAGAVTAGQVVDTLRRARPDLVVFGNVHSAATDGRVVGEIARQFPSAFVLHDLWLLTGRCAYAGACDRYLSPAGCDASCPTAGEYPRLEPDRIHDAWQFKRDLLHSDRAPALLANSRWMLDVARRVLAVPVDHLLRPRPAPSAAIRLAFPVGAFTPQDKRQAREQLGLPQDRFLVLFSASSLDDRRKGVGHLVEAMRLLDLPDVTTVCVGRYDAESKPDLPDLRVMGYMDDPRRLATLYSAVDLFVGPSVEEALGQVYIEAAACGTPSVGYPVGGVPEAVVDGVTGRVAASVSPAALAEAIRELHDNPGLRGDMGRWARLVVENEWSEETALHRWHTAMAATGLADRIGLAPGIRIAARPHPVPPVESIPPQHPTWRAVSGLGPWEGPYPEWHLPRCRWVTGQTAVFDLPADVDGRHRVMVECFNALPGQRLSLRTTEDGGDEPAVVRRVPVTAGGNAFIAMFDLPLTRGWNRLELRCEAWHDVPGTDRKQAVLVSGIICRPWE